MSDMLAVIIEEMRTDQGLSQTELASRAWPDKEKQVALVKYQRIIKGQTLTVADGSALAGVLGSDLSKLLVLAEDRRRRKV